MKFVNDVEENYPYKNTPGNYCEVNFSKRNEKVGNYDSDTYIEHNSKIF